MSTLKFSANRFSLENTTGLPYLWIQFDDQTDHLSSLPNSQHLPVSALPVKLPSRSLELWCSSGSHSQIRDHPVAAEVQGSYIPRESVVVFREWEETENWGHLELVLHSAKKRRVWNFLNFFLNYSYQMLIEANFIEIKTLVTIPAKITFRPLTRKPVTRSLRVQLSRKIKTTFFGDLVTLLHLSFANKKFHQNFLFGRISSMISPKLRFHQKFHQSFEFSIRISMILASFSTN